MKTALWLVWAIMLVAGRSAAADGSDGVDWLDDDSLAFERAQATDRPVLLYMEAVWCHWCHVMDQETYGDVTVRALLAEHFIPLRIDQDSRPDLANRYRDFGWPATIFLTPDGRDMVKRQGFIAPEPFARLLRAIVADPSPEASARLALPESAPPTSNLPDWLSAELNSRHISTHDSALGGLTIAQKFLDRDSVELDMVLCDEDADEAACTRAQKSLDGALKLLDPVWGGVYQYSTYGDFDHPHYEKLTVIQGEYLRIYALAYQQFNEARYADAAQSIARYLADFMSDEAGGYYASQDSDIVQGEKAHDYFARDDDGRRALGIPRIDKSVYARETAVVAEGLAMAAIALDSEPMLNRAIKAVEHVASEYRSQEGFAHASGDTQAPYLSDQLAMGRAGLALYMATSERRWLELAVNAGAIVVDDRFEHSSGGFPSAVNQGQAIAPVPQTDENISVGRFLNLLYHYSGDERFLAAAQRALGFLGTREVGLKRITEAGILLMDRELNQLPLHLTVTGTRHSAPAKQLFTYLIRRPGWYKRVEWWDRAEGPLLHDNVSYPELDRPAAFVCTDNTCSLPLFTPAAIAQFLAR